MSYCDCAECMNYRRQGPTYYTRNGDGDPGWEECTKGKDMDNADDCEEFTWRY